MGEMFFGFWVFFRLSKLNKNVFKKSLVQGLVQKNYLIIIRYQCNYYFGKGVLFNGKNMILGLRLRFKFDFIINQLYGVKSYLMILFIFENKRVVLDDF